MFAGGGIGGVVGQLGVVFIAMKLGEYFILRGSGSSEKEGGLQTTTA